LATLRECEGGRRGDGTGEKGRRGGNGRREVGMEKDWNG